MLLRDFLATNNKYFDTTLQLPPITEHPSSTYMYGVKRDLEGNTNAYRNSLLQSSMGPGTLMGLCISLHRRQSS